jgi:FkbM family methyltransferase
LHILINNLTLKSKIYAIGRHPSIIKDIIQGKSLAEIGSKVSQLDFLQGTRDNRRRECVYLGDYKALIRTMFAHKMYLDTRDIIISPHLLLDGYWEPWITNVLLGELKSGMNIIEIGSNVGYYSLIISSKIGHTGRLFAFEANPDIYQILRDNIQINGFCNRVTLENRAVIDKAEKIAFEKVTEYSTTSRVVEYSKVNQYSEELKIIKVDATSLDQYFNNKDIKIELIKMDAEGSEPHIFEGMKNLIINNADITIICEFNPVLISAASVDPRKFLEKIQSYGFILKYIDFDSIPKEAPIEKLLQLGVVDLYLKKR